MKLNNFSRFIVLTLLLLVASSISLFAGDTEEEKVTVTPYGTVRLDAIYETGASSHGNYTLWAIDPGNSDGMFYVTARHTRLGMKIKGISFGKFNLTGQVEVDFYSSGVPENKSYNFMRHAFLTVSNGTFSIIAGQTSDIISPLFPATLNYPVHWGAGNIGYRRPLLAFKQVFKSGKSSFSIHAGISPTITGDYDGDGLTDGLESGMPTFQGRIGADLSLGSSSSLQIGFSGHYGKSTGLVEYTSDSINIDFSLNLGKFKLLGEYFSGKNLGTFLGGIVQDVNTTLGQEIKAKGYFVNAVLAVSSKLTFSAGYGMDDPDDANLSSGLRAKNSCGFGNFVIKLSPSLSVGLEISNWVTDYLNQEQQKSLRFQHCWYLTF